MIEELANAIRDNDVSKARELLGNNAELRAKLNDPLPGEAFGGLAIGAATRNRNGAMLDLLIANGADINARTDWWAGSFGLLESCDKHFARELIARGATVDASSAARLGDIDRLRALIKENPNCVHERRGDGKTPLHYASTVAVAELLLDNGADINAIDVDHESTPAQYLIHDHPDVASYLVTRGCRTDILLATALGADQLVERMLEENSNVALTRVDGLWFPMSNPRAGGCIYTWTLGSNKSAYMIAREMGQVHIAKLLVDRMSPAQQLADFCMLGESDNAMLLLEIDPDLLSELGPVELSALSSAIFDDRSNAVKLMLDLDWPVNVADANGVTPLHSAAWHGRADLVKTLLEKGANPFVVERQFNATPLGWAHHGSENSWLRKKGDYPTVISLLTAAA